MSMSEEKRARRHAKRVRRYDFARVEKRVSNFPKLPVRCIDCYAPLFPSKDGRSVACDGRNFRAHSWVNVYFRRDDGDRRWYE